MISFAGNVTFPKAQQIRDAALEVPLDRIFIETDCPYLAPIPHRGKRNEPAYVKETARKIGSCAGSRWKRSGSGQARNFYKFFKFSEIAESKVPAPLSLEFLLTSGCDSFVSERLEIMPDNSFDVVSKVDMQEVSNAIQQALKEVHTRFDLKDSKSNIELEKDAIVLHSADEYKLKAVNDILQQKLVKRGVSLKALTYGAVEPAAGGTAKRRVTMQQGIAIEKAREIVKLIKDSKKKAQASIQGDLVRISGKDRDTLQEVIAVAERARLRNRFAVCELQNELVLPRSHRVTEKNSFGFLVSPCLRGEPGTL